MICLASFTLAFTTCGTAFSFGVYQELYQSMAKQPNTPFTGASPAIIDLIGTLSVSLMTLAAPFSTAWTQRFSPRVIISFGGVLLIVAAVLASYSQALWQFLLTQGVLMGLSTSFSYIPAVTVAPTYYTNRRALALGIILSGTGIGGLVWAPLLQKLNEHIGFRNTLRVSGAVCSASVLAAATVMDWDPTTKAHLADENARLAARAHGTGVIGFLRKLYHIPLVNWHIARSAKFASEVVANFLHAAAYFTPLFFLSAYAKTLGFSASEGATFIAVNNVASSVGRIIIGIAADRYGRINLLVVSTAISAAAALAFWLPSTAVPASAARGLFITFAVINGATTGAFTSLFPATLIDLFGPQNFASINGVVYMLRGCASMIGTPGAGALLRHDHAGPHAYLTMSVLVGCLLSGAALASFWIKAESKRP